MTMTDTTARHLGQSNAYAVHVHWRNGIHRRYTFDTLTVAHRFASDLWTRRGERLDADGQSRLVRVATYASGTPRWQADSRAPYGEWVKRP